MSSGDLTVCIVGAGPRGLSVLERICANERKEPSRAAVTVHVVDSARPGAGRVWRTDQPPQLLMNTVASQVTVYTDASVTMHGPVETGPSLHEWAVSLSEESSTRPNPSGHERAFLTEAASLGPDSYPSRALYGRYLEEAFDRAAATAPTHIHLVEHRSHAIALDDDPLTGEQTLTLTNGTRITGLDAVILAQGHVPARTSPDEERLTREANAHGLLHILPANPADVDLSAVRPGEAVLLRGLGLNFFDHMALLTLGRGGRFERSGDRLVYRPSTREPRLYAGSRRGIPYHARGENEKGPHGRHLPALLTQETIERLHRNSPNGERLHFGRDLWPLIAKEVESVYYTALLKARVDHPALQDFTERYLAAPAGTAEQDLLDEYALTPGERWNWEEISRPYGSRVFAHRDDFRDWLLAHLEQDVAQARSGNVNGPLKAALDVLRDVRNEVRLAVDHGRIEGNSYRDDLQGWYTPLNAFLSIGPPVSRIEEMAALMEAGVLEVLGPGMNVHIDTAGRAAFVATSDRVGGPPVHASVLIEARLPEPDVRRAADPLLTYLLATGQARSYRIAGDCGTSYETGGLAVTERPYRVIDAAGRPHPRRFAYGVPTEAVHWATAAGIRPGVDSVTLGDSDALARTVLRLEPAAAVTDLRATEDSGFSEAMA
ncbi:FAD/NAD(P)-binding protein [Streptomyces spiramenti]|uniref:FAD/NAD(P)-binding protein n=1 Tax=Streptomyces spiramenti TaxID=2720606 RepID=A0ABX1AJD1_9ACTN|nr:FAD/NAD(P)-binding protein [Streptomyces spiramenti]NJP65503.1 FAD/NAD(P)-binding protein [Streptomyces spiramenti]